MSNFSGISKSSKPFRPQVRGSALEVFEKANSPILDTDKAPDSGNRGQRELGVSVDRIDRDGGAQYVDAASVLRQSIAQLSGLTDTSSIEAVKRLSALADQIEGKNVVTAPYSDFVGRVGADYLKPVHKSEPTLADLKAELNKQVAILTERLRGLIARGSGVEITERSGSGRFVTKGKTVAEQELHKALENGRPVQFSGQDPRDAAEKSAGSGRKFEPRR